MSLILGIESSCDETGIAIYDDVKLEIIAQSLFSQIDIHQQYGGVMPEIASRHHLKRFIPLLKECLLNANLGLNAIDFISYTAGPGLNGALLVGTVMANTLAYILDKPSLPIHHLEGHLLSPLLEKNSHLEYPFLVLLVSGGHTQLILVKEFGKYQIVGDTLDDAAGEAFDKTAKMLGFPYPGGIHIAKHAVNGRDLYKLPRPMINSGNLDMSFSGLKTSCSLLIQSIVSQHNCSVSELPLEILEDISFAVEQAITDTLVSKTQKAIEKYQVTTLVVSGGVSANQTLRRKFQDIKIKNSNSNSNSNSNKKINIIYPPLNLCTDNGAMIALAGAYRKEFANKKYICNTYPRWNLEGLPEFYK